MMPDMQEVMQKLLRLQERDTRISTLQREEKQAPVEKARLQQQFASIEARLEAARKREKEIEAEKKNLEVEAGAIGERIARYKTQQMQTRKNEEYAALSHEIDAAKKIISDLEDKELALMDEADSLAPALAAAQKEYEEAKKSVESRLAAMEERLLRTVAECADLQQTRSGLTTDIEPDVVRVYERLFASKGGNAIVALEGEICSGCHMKVPAQTIVETKAGKHIVHCPLCGRILYYPG
jgi:predicted  nucleic acid-binding Zn-ribbon protein